MKSLLLLVFMLYSYSAYTAEIVVKYNYIVINGSINKGDALRFINAYTDETKIVFLNSQGGLLHEALFIARIIEEKSFNTFVVNGDICLSACFNMFIAGKKRQADTLALIGVHKAHGKNVAQVEKLNQLMVQHAYKHGISEDIIYMMHIVDHNKIYYLTSRQKEEINLGR